MTPVSPPDTGHHQQGMEMLTPSPVSMITFTAERSLVQDGHRLPQVTPQPGKLHQVRMMNYPVHQTPCTRTPGQAARGRKSSLKKSRGGKESKIFIQFNF